ncbi:MAG TPA: hypothetical protein VMT44_03800, partial [Methanoregula sp.]|nr:hypothetical protein [Methanoregula sp.]
MTGGTGSGPVTGRVSRERRSEAECRTSTSDELSELEEILMNFFSSSRSYDLSGKKITDNATACPSLFRQRCRCPCCCNT